MKAERLRVYSKAISYKSMIGTSFAVLDIEKQKIALLRGAMGTVTGKTFTEESGVL